MVCLALVALAGFCETAMVREILTRAVVSRPAAGGKRRAEIAMLDGRDQSVMTGRRIAEFGERHRLRYQPSWDRDSTRVPSTETAANCSVYNDVFVTLEPFRGFTRHALRGVLV